MVEAANEEHWSQPIDDDSRCDDPHCDRCATAVIERYRCDVVRCDNGEVLSAGVDWFPGWNLPPGAMYFLRLSNHGGGIHPGDYLFFEGPHLHVVLPNGHEWNIDARARNCDRRDDITHRCWVRHGEPPDITVDKNGNTCTAGGGSIHSGDYHGFLRDGAFT